MSSKQYKYIRAEILAMPAYKVHSANDKIKLDAMENPFSLPDSMQQKLANYIYEHSSQLFNRYPNPELYEKTISSIRAYASIGNSLDILLGNGSDEIISMLSNILPHNATVLAPQPGFIMYKLSSIIAKLNFIGVDTFAADNFALNMPNMLKAIKEHAPRLIYLAYPNNPTGNCYAPADILTIIQNAPDSLVVIDEAYQPFTNGKSYMGQLADITQIYPNILVMRTLSKLGLAGLRLGYIAGSVDIIEQLNKVRPPYNLNVLTQLATQFLLMPEHASILQQQTAQLCTLRQKLAQKLTKYGKVFASDANFILWQAPININIDDFSAFIMQHNILIKNLDNMHIELKNCLRISIGTPQEMEYLTSVFEQYF
jgi:histidinol-phosphate aminotransferase